MINTRQDFADYCLRQLGGGVINIEISDEQIEDNIDQAIQYYQEYHFDGIERDYLIRRITATTFSVADTVGWAVGESVGNTNNSIYATITSIVGTTITIGKTSGGVFKNTDVLSNGIVTKTISSVVLGDVDNKYLPADETIVGVIRVLNINKMINTTEYMFDAKYQIMMNEIRNLTSGSMSYMYGMMQYLGELAFVLNKEKDFRFNRRMNKIFLDINWGSDLAIGDAITVEVYRALNEEAYSQILNDLWLKKYCSALFKKQWGSNLKKYSSMQMPGGVTYNGQQIYDEAVTEINKLEEEAISQSAPLSFFVG